MAHASFVLENWVNMPQNVGAVSYIVFLCWVRVEQQDRLQQRLIFIVTQPSTHINTGKDCRRHRTTDRPVYYLCCSVRTKKNSSLGYFLTLSVGVDVRKCFCLFFFFMSLWVNSLWITICVVSVIVINNQIWVQMKSPSTNTTWMCIDRCSEYELHFTYLC